jgi:hypothetical protein
MLGFAVMADDIENRSQRRYRASVAVACWSFGTDNFRDARVVNFSENGLCIESAVEYPEKAAIFLRIVDVQAAPAVGKQSSSLLRTSATAEVKWCRKFCDEGRNLFLIGLKHYPSEY